MVHSAGLILSVIFRPKTDHECTTKTLLATKPAPDNELTLSQAGQIANLTTQKKTEAYPYRRRGPSHDVVLFNLNHHQGQCRSPNLADQGGLDKTFQCRANTAYLNFNQVARLFLYVF